MNKINGLKHSILIIVLSLYCTHISGQIHYLLAKGEVSLNQEETYGVQFRVSEQKIWISLTGLMELEGVRCLVEKDSTFIINKIDKSLTTINNEIGYGTLGIPIDKDVMKNILLSQYDDTLWKSEDSFHTIYSNFEHETLYRYIVDKKTKEIDKIVLHRPEYQDRMVVFFDQYETIDSQRIAMKRKIDIIQPNAKNTIDITYNKVKLNEIFNQPFDKTYAK